MPVSYGYLLTPSGYGQNESRRPKQRCRANMSCVAWQYQVDDKIAGDVIWHQERNPSESASSGQCWQSVQQRRGRRANMPIRQWCFSSALNKRGPVFRARPQHRPSGCRRSPLCRRLPTALNASRRENARHWARSLCRSSGAPVESPEHLRPDDQTKSQRRSTAHPPEFADATMSDAQQTSRCCAVRFRNIDQRAT